jgi:16S rRNA (guanine966-N2)-methyltransferase
MRVIAGTARGVLLAAPPGRETRPITDRVKETLFDILGERVLDARLLDLYAGSGAIGIEGLSRGAASCTFVEHGRAAVAAIRQNLARTELAERATVRQVTVERYLAAAEAGSWDLAVLDPPYAERAILAPLERLAAVLPTGSVVVVKHFWRYAPPSVPGLAVRRERRLGETTLSFCERVGTEEGEGAGQ